MSVSCFQQGGILRTVWIEAGAHLRDCYTRMMAVLYNAHLKVYYEGGKDSIVDDLIQLENDH